MHPQSEHLASKWIGDFFAANQDITWLAVEEEKQLWLDSQTLLIGKVDARGLTSDGEPFFGEWKTKNGYWAKRAEEVKQTWRMNPQALTYAVLNADLANRFTVRWTFKTEPPQTAFEWYTYSPAEIAHWRSQLLHIAGQIRVWRHLAGEGPWLTNYLACDRFGVKYRCPHFNNGCGILDFVTPTGPPREPHTALEARLSSSATNPLIPNGPAVVVLSSSRVGDYLACPEKYRRNWEGVGYHDESEALEIGRGFHETVAAHLSTLIRAKELDSVNTTGVI